MLHKSQRKKNHRSCSRAHQGRFIGLLNHRFWGEGGAVCAVQRRFSLRWPKMRTFLPFLPGRTSACPRTDIPDCALILL